MHLASDLARRRDKCTASHMFIVRRSLKAIFVRDGYLRPIYGAVLVIAGGAIVFLDFDVRRTGWIYIVGLAIGGFGGYAARAQQLGIRSFEDRPYPHGLLRKRRAGLPKTREDTSEKAGQ